MFKWNRIISAQQCLHCEECPKKIANWRKAILQLVIPQESMNLLDRYSVPSLIQKGYISWYWTWFFFIYFFYCISVPPRGKKIYMSLCWDKKSIIWVQWTDTCEVLTHLPVSAWPWIPALSTPSLVKRPSLALPQLCLQIVFLAQ